VLAACFVLTLAAWRKNDASARDAGDKRLTDYRTPLGETLRHPQAWLSVLTFVLYVGAEISLGTWTYTLLTESRGVDPTVAGFFAGSYWAMFTIGRALAGLYARRVGVHRMVTGGLLGALLGTGLLAWNPAPLASLLAVAIIGFSIAPIFPALMSGTSERVGARHAANVIGMQMGATGLGMAAIPGLMGVLARHTSLEVIPLCLLAVYMALLAVYTGGVLLRQPRPARAELATRTESHRA